MLNDTRPLHDQDLTDRELEVRVCVCIDLHKSPGCGRNPRCSASWSTRRRGYVHTQMYIYACTHAHTLTLATSGLSALLSRCLKVSRILHAGCTHLSIGSQSQVVYIFIDILQFECPAVFLHVVFELARSLRQSIITCLHTLSGVTCHHT